MSTPSLTMRTRGQCHRSVLFVKGAPGRAPHPAFFRRDGPTRARLAELVGYQIGDSRRRAPTSSRDDQGRRPDPGAASAGCGSSSSSAWAECPGAMKSDSRHCQGRGRAAPRPRSRLQAARPRTCVPEQLPVKLPIPPGRPAFGKKHVAVDGHQFQRVLVAIGGRRLWRICSRAVADPRDEAVFVPGRSPTGDLR